MLRLRDDRKRQRIAIDVGARERHRKRRVFIGRDALCGSDRRIIVHTDFDGERRNTRVQPAIVHLKRK